MPLETIITRGGGGAERNGGRAAYSGELRLSPRVVRSVPRARVLRSGSVMRMTLSNPSSPNLSGTGGVCLLRLCVCRVKR